MIGIIYRTTCLITRDKYIGKHECNSTNFDGYLGSGKIIKAAIKKYGKENFIRQVIRVVDDDENINELEKYYIKIYDAVNREDFYNITEGGDGAGAGEHSCNFGRVCSNETKEKIRKKATGRHHSEKTKEHLSKINKGKKCPQLAEYNRLYAKGGPGTKVYTEEYPDIIFESIYDAARESKKLGWSGITHGHIRETFRGIRKSCGKDNLGNKLHWKKL